MSIEKIALIGIGSSLGIAGPVIAGTNFFESKTIWDIVSEDAVPEGDSTLEDVWTEIKSKLSSKKQDSEFRQIKESSGTQELKSWCSKAYKMKYKDLFSVNESLLRDVNLACKLSIREKLGELSILTKDDKETFKSNLETLKTYSEETVHIEKELIDLREKVKKEGDKDKHWEELKSWCDKTYDRGYLGENSRWKLVNKFCKKTT